MSALDERIKELNRLIEKSEEAKDRIAAQRLQLELDGKLTEKVEALLDAEQQRLEARGLRERIARDQLQLQLHEIELRTLDVGKRPREEESTEDDKPSKKQRRKGEVSDPPTSAEVEEELVKLFGVEMRRMRHQALPGALRKDRLEDRTCLAQCVELAGRKETFSQWVYWVSNIFKRWCARGPTDVNELRRGLVQILLLSFSGAGKTTFLEMLPALLRAWLQDQGDAKCLAALQHYMFARERDDLTEADKNTALVMLQALHMLAGRDDGAPHFFFMLRVLDQPKPLPAFETTPEIGAALRLLAAMLTPIQPRPEELSPGLSPGLPPKRSTDEPAQAGFTYEHICELIPTAIRGRLEIKHVVGALRTALGFSVNQLCMFIIMVDECNAADGVFKDEGAKRVADVNKVNWVLQFLSSVLSFCAKICSDIPPSIIVPLVASTLYESIDMTYARQCTATGNSTAVQLGLPPLTLEQMEHVILTLCRRVAARWGRTQPDALPQAVKNCLPMLGGSPRLTTIFAEAIAGHAKTARAYKGLEGLEHEWLRDFDLQVSKVEAGTCPILLTKVKEKGQDALYWQRILDPRNGQPLKLAALKCLVGLVLTDKVVKRSERLVPTDPTSDPIGFWEEGGLVQLTIEGSDVVDVMPAEAASSSNTPRSEQTKLQSNTSSPNAKAGSSSGAGSTTPLSPSARKRVGEEEFVSVTRSHMLGVWLEDGNSGSAPSVSKPSPSKTGLIDGMMSCARPSSNPSAQPVRVSISPLVLQYLMEQLGLLQHEDLTVFSSQVDRESEDDKEFIDAGMFSLKLLGHYISGVDTVSLDDLLPGKELPAVAQGVRFVIPYGHIQVAPCGMRMDSWLEPSQVSDYVKVCQDSILNSRAKPAGADRRLRDVTIGYVGVGNMGLDSMVVLVDMQGQAWIVVVQSKQVLRAGKSTYATTRGILANFATDLEKTFDLPVPIPSQWTTWHTDKPERGGGDGVPDVDCGSQASDRADRANLLPFDRVLYVYVTDAKFTTQQEAIFDKVLKAGHPWLKRVIVISSGDNDSYYTRVGALKRATMRKTLTSKLAPPS